MLSISDDLRATLTASHVQALRAELWYDGELIAARLPVTGGSVKWDGDADVACRATFAIADVDAAAFPIGASGISAYGTEVYLERGAYVPGGDAEYVPLGRLRIQDDDLAEWFRTDASGEWITAGFSAEGEALDRLQAVEDARFLAPESSPTEKTCKAELRRLLRGIVPLGTWDAIEDAATPAGLTYDESRLAAVVKLADALGAQLYTDRNGTAQLRSTAWATEPVWTFDGTAAGGGLESLAWKDTRDGVYNAVVARGESTGDNAPPVQAVAYDVTPASPTRWGGPFGRVPYFYSSPLITTKAQAEAAAKTRLDNLLRGRERTVTFSALPLPFLEVGDTVAVTTPRVHLRGVLVGMEIPLAPEKASYTVRAAESGITVIDLGEDTLWPT